MALKPILDYTAGVWGRSPQCSRRRARARLSPPTPSGEGVGASLPEKRHFFYKLKQRFYRPLFFCDKIQSFLKKLLIFLEKYAIIIESVHSLNIEEEKYGTVF